MATYSQTISIRTEVQQANLDRALKTIGRIKALSAQVKPINLLAPGTLGGARNVEKIQQELVKVERTAKNINANLVGPGKLSSTFAGAVDQANAFRQVLQNINIKTKDAGDRVETFANAFVKATLQAERLESQVDEVVRKAAVLQNAEFLFPQGPATRLGTLDELTQRQKFNEEERRTRLQTESLLERKRTKSFQTAIRRLNFRRRERLRTEQLVAERREKALSGALTGGAFPLLFGQGIGGALGGGIGGAAGGFLGGGFELGLSLAGTTLGSAVDNFIQNLGELANSLNDPTRALEALKEAGIRVNKSVTDQVDSLLEAGRAYDAQSVVLAQINQSLGPQAVGQLAAYKEETDQLNASFQTVANSITTAMLPALSGLLTVVNQLIKAATSKEVKQAAVRGGLLPAAAGLAAGNPLIAALTAAGIAIPGLATKIGIDRGAESEPDRGEARDQQQRLERIARNRLEIVSQERDLLKITGTILDDNVYRAREAAIIRKAELNEQNLILEKKGTEETVTKNLLDRDKQLAALARERSNAEERLARQKQRLAKQVASLSDREQKQFERSQQTGAALIRRLEQDVALKKASTPLERELLKIAYAKEATQVRINQLLDPLQQARALELIDEREKLAIIEAQVDAKLALAGLGKTDLEKTFFDGDSGRAPGFAAGFGLDLTGRDQEALDKFLEKYKQVGQAAQVAGQLVTFGFRDMIAGVKSVEQVFADFLNSLADMLLKTAQQMIAQYIAIGVARLFAVGGTGTGPGDFNLAGFGNLSSSGGGGGIAGFMAGAGGILGRANGGPVSNGTPYMVGERGPELFVPRSSGTIIPNNALGGGANVTVNVDASGSNVQGDSNQASQLGKAIGAAVQAELVKQKRPGGLLAGV